MTYYIIMSFHPRLVGSVSDIRPIFNCRSTTQFEDKKELFNLCVARENRLGIEELSKNTSDGPDVNTSTIAILCLCCAQQEFWGSIPERDDPVCVVLLSILVRLQPSKAPVSDFQVSSARDQKITSLDIPMKYLQSHTEVLICKHHRGTIHLANACAPRH